MAKQKTIPELEAEKAENERKLSQLQHKKQQLENRITYYEKGDRRKGRKRREKSRRGAEKADFHLHRMRYRKRPHGPLRQNGGAALC